MRKTIISTALLLVSFVSINSQSVNSTYFLNEWSLRHKLNASFAPEYGYLSLPIMSGIQVNLQSNTGMSNFIYPYNSEHVTFLHPSVNGQDFMNKLSSTVSINQSMSINLLSFGFYTSRNSFWSFTVGMKENLNMRLPKDFFRLAKLGMEKSTNTFDLKDLTINQSEIAHVGLGFSKEINNKLRVGVNVKLMVGLGMARVNYSKFDVSLNNNHFEVDAIGESLLMAEFIDIEKDADNVYDYGKIDFNSSKIKLSGLGVAFDLGVSYKPIKKLTLAAGINDLGFIKWKDSAVKRGIASGKVTFDGFTNIDVEDVNVDDQLDQLKEDAEKLIKFKQTASSGDFKERTDYTINASAEYSIFGNDRHDILVGLLWQNYNSPYWKKNDLVAALTLKPLPWFTLSGTCELLRKDFNRYGLALNISPKWINIIIASDFITPKVNKQYMPIDKFDLNLMLGISFVVGRGRDSDRDGVADRKDKCPDTDFGTLVDKKGCPQDSDGDGITDMYDKCPNTPKEAYGKVDIYGCPNDSDGDGVPDYLDKCPDTPLESKTMVDVDGCPLDSDKDGVFDYLDKCPDTPADVKVDVSGCPLDEDGDGVADYLDVCPATPAAAKGKVDVKGCPIDTDGDGIFDYLDQCPNTPVEARGKVGSNGCPLDTDGDGVPDYMDNCPDTPKEAIGKVDVNGCLIDTDNDSVPDYLDECPKIVGVKANKGCPEIKKEIRTLFQKALQGIQFKTGKSVILPISYPILDQIAKVLIDNPTYLLEIKGHTDNVGKPEANLILSEARAAAVKGYLVKKGAPENRMTSKGLGDTVPVADNKKEAGRKLNRRVEFTIIFEETRFE